MHQILKVTKYTDILQTLLHSKSCLAKIDFYHGILLALATTCSMQWGNQLKFIAWAESVQLDSSVQVYSYESLGACICARAHCYMGVLKVHL